jgi:hypothetical protein
MADLRELALLSRFAAGRVTAAEGNAGPDKGFATIWYPKVAGRYVRVDSLNDGYDDRWSALLAARKYRDRCRAALSNQGEG